MNEKKLNFGCGNQILNGYDNVDIQTDKRLTKSFDFDKFPYPLKENTYDHILMRMVIEHLEKPDKTLYELHRICKPQAIIRIITTFYNNIGMTNDMEHRHYFSHKTFIEFIRQSTKIHKRNMFKIRRLELKPTFIGNIFPKIIREKVCLFVGGLIGNLECDLEVIKR